MIAVFTKKDELLLSSVKGPKPKEIEDKLSSGDIRQITRGIYTENLVDPVEMITRRNIWSIIAHQVPEAIVDFRTRILGKPETDGTVFLSYKYKRTIDDIPGLKIKLIKNLEPTEGDTPFLEALYWASEARSWLNVMSLTRTRKGEISKGFSDEEAEERIERIIRTRGIDGPKGINKLRDEARGFSQEHNFGEEFKRLNQLIAKILTTHEHPGKQKSKYSHMLVADRERVRLFQLLCNALLEHEIEGIHIGQQSPDFRQNLAFFESYFSNFIEGTEFLIDEAKEIVFENKIIPNRTDDSHDILGTFRILSDITGMQQTPNTKEDFIEKLKSRHSVILASRSDKRPGEFKERPNRAGNTLFVLPELVEGTLAEGFDIAQVLTEPLSRAIYMMFLVAEVHPFEDGNGRIARVMMNSELQAAEQMRIIVPTVCRDNYILGLRNLSRNAEPLPLIRFLEKLQRFTNSIQFQYLTEAQTQLEGANAFSEPDEAQLNFV